MHLGASANMRYQTLDNLDLTNRSVFLRLDLNTPLADGKVNDDTRIQAALPTIKHILEQTNRLCIASHLGRPKGTKDPRFSLAPVGERIAELLGLEVLLFKDYEKEPIDQALQQLGRKQIILLENLRFHKEEKANEASFAESLIKGFDYYIDDAFGAVHRAHASVERCAELMPYEKKAVGRLIEKEISALDKLTNGEVPFTVVLGGAKVSDKIGTILTLLTRCNHLIIGGAMAYTFLKCLGHSIGSSKAEDGQAHLIEAIFEKASKHNVTIHLPSDHLCTTNFDSDEEPTLVETKDIPKGLMGLDIGPKTIKEFDAVIRVSKTVFWNGPLGVFEKEAYSKGTKAIASTLANARAYTVAGGGDSLAAINKTGLANKFSHLSTGGGASLEYLEGKKLPGLVALENK